MPRKVSQLQLRNRAQISNAYQVVVTDPTNFALYRVPATQFRGASVFTSENDPTTTPEDPLITEYVDGDIYIQDTQSGQKLFIWDAVNSAWSSANKLNGLRLLSASDFPDETNLDLRETNFISDIAYENDYYLNKTLDLLFGTYAPATGFKFGSTDFTGYKGFRAPITHIFQGSDAAGYDNPSFYLDQYLNSAATLKQKIVAKRPIHNDLVYIQLENDEGHGGWYYTFDTSIIPTGTTLLQNYNLLLGTTIAGDQPLVKKHWREAKTWNETTSPVQNDNKYRQGDNVFNVAAGVLYYGYQEGLPANTTDLGTLFEGQTVLAGSSLKTSQDVNGDWINPSANDSLYKTGDYIFTRNLNTPRIHGPYLAGASSDLSAWSIYAVLRNPVEHRIPYNATVPTSYSEEYPVLSYDTGIDDGNGGTIVIETMVVDGDKIRKIWTEGKKEKAHTEGVAVNYSEVVGERTLTWGSTFVNKFPTKIHTSTATSEPSKDIMTYSDGDIVRNAQGDLYKFVEGTDVASSSFELLPNIRANITHIANTTSTNFIPATANNNAQWGGGTVQDNDTLEVRYTGKNKVVHYTAEVNEVDSTILWKDKRNKFGQQTFTDFALYTDPVADNTKYTTDDFFINASGRRYKYSESANTNLGGWTFLQWDRSAETFVTTKTNTFTPAVDASDFLTDTSITQKRLKTGDRILVSATGTTKDKVFYFDVTGEAPAIFSAKRNPNVTKIHVESSASRPNRNDANYSTGDFLDNPSTGWRYGPYVEGASDDVTAWPDFRQLVAEDYSINLEHDPARIYTVKDLVTKDGSLYKANSAIDGSTTPVPFVEGVGVGEWTMVLQGASDIRATDVTTDKYYFEVTGSELFFKKK